MNNSSSNPEVDISNTSAVTQNVIERNEEKQPDNYQQAFEIFINNILCPVFIPIFSLGLFGTLISLCFILARRHLYSCTVKMWFVSLALTDIAVVCLKALPTPLQWTYPEFRYAHYLPNIHVCRLLHFTLQFLEPLSPFLLVGLSIERSIAVLRPLEVATLITPRRSGLGLTLCFLLALGWGLAVLAGVRYERPSATSTLVTCHVDPNYASQIYIYDAVINRLSALSLLVATTFVILRGIIRGSRQRRKLVVAVTTGQPTPGQVRSSSLRRELRLGSILVGMNLLFLLTVYPSLIYHLNYLRAMNKTAYNEAVPEALHAIVSYTLWALTWTGNAYNWIFYCGTTKEFRTFVQNAILSRCRLMRNFTSGADPSRENTSSNH